MKANRCNAILLLSLFAMAASAQVSYRISGTWEKGAGKTVYLTKELSKEQRDTVNKAVVAPDCSFALQGTTDKMQEMELRFGEKQASSLFIDGEPIVVDITAKETERKGVKSTYYSATVKGSRQQEVLKNGNDLTSMSALMQLGKMFSLARAQERGQAALDSALIGVHQLDSALQVSIANYMDTTRNDYASTAFFGYLMQNYSYDKVTGFYAGLTDRVKQSSAGVDLKKRIDEMGTVSVGGISPDIKLPTPKGTEFSLYDLRGRIVLLDFWASWCGPCLREMPNVKALYEKYHDKGLEILGVSLDEKKDAWTAAIAKHGLKWHHVSSLKGWKCPVAALFKVTGIPRMYIIDREGKIIAQDLRGEALAQKMAELFNE